MTQSTTNIHQTDLDSETYRSQAPDPVGDQAHQMPGSDRSLALLFVRYVVPALLVCSAFVLFAFEPNETGLAGWAMLMGSGLSVARLVTTRCTRLGSACGPPRTPSR